MPKKATVTIDICLPYCKAAVAYIVNKISKKLSMLVGIFFLSVIAYLRHFDNVRVGNKDFGNAGVIKLDRLID